MEQRARIDHSRAAVNLYKMVLRKNTGIRDEAIGSRDFTQIRIRRISPMIFYEKVNLS